MAIFAPFLDLQALTLAALFLVSRQTCSFTLHSPLLFVFFRLCISVLGEIFSHRQVGFWLCIVKFVAVFVVVDVRVP
jgi:hypothetical protein